MAKESAAFPRKIAFWFYAFLIVVGIVFYVVWGTVYGSWNILTPSNAGVYAVTVVLLGFGIVGMLLYRRAQ
jgi:hypothetical protein